MKIEKGVVASFSYVLSDAEGLELESNTMAYLHGHGNILLGLEKALEGLEAGAAVNVTLPPEEAYGPVHDNAIQRVPVKHLIQPPKRLQVDMFVQINTEQGPRMARILKAGKFMVDLDLNHPFAGQTLVFKLDIKEVRAATPEELAHGHAHGEGGHEH